MTRRHNDGPFDLAVLLDAAREAARSLYGGETRVGVSTVDGHRWLAAAVTPSAEHHTCARSTAIDAAKALLSSLHIATRERDAAALDAEITDDRAQS